MAYAFMVLVSYVSQAYAWHMPALLVNNIKPPAAEALQMPVGCRGTQIWIARVFNDRTAAPLCTLWSGSCLVADDLEAG
jgi:hypothetical protein